MEITVETTVDAPLAKVWSAWTTPGDIMHWNFAIDSWCCPRAEIDLNTGGKFNYRMEARDGSMGFDFVGIFTKINEGERIEFSLGDERQVKVEFLPSPKGIRVVETFEAEDKNAAEQQRQGWQSILNNFKKHVEGVAN